MANSNFDSKFRYWGKVRNFFSVLVLGVFLGYGFRAEWFVIKSPSDWTAASAMATFFAGLIALGVACFGFYRQRKEQIHFARIVAASAHANLVKISATLDVLLEGAFDDQPLGDGPKANLSGLWSIEKISIEQITCYAHAEPFLGSILADSRSRLITLLELRGIPKDFSHNYIYEGFVQASKTKENQEQIYSISMNLKSVLANMEVLRYKKD